MADFAALTPAHNATAAIREVIRLIAVIPPRDPVVDDGSTDGTRPRAEEAGACAVGFSLRRRLPGKKT